MKKCILLFFLLLLLACQDKKYFRDFIDVSDAIIYGCEVSKPSLLCLIDDNDKILSIKNCDTLVANFVCYMLHDPMKTDVGKIVHPSEYPIYVILERDSIVSILSSEEMKKELGKEDRRALKDRLLRSKYDGNNDIAYSELLINLETGRTHQIRVHTAYIGHPILGDSLYGNESNLINRQALHAYKVEFIHPITNKQLEFIAPIPDDMKLLLN